MPIWPLLIGAAAGVGTLDGGFTAAGVIAVAACWQAIREGHGPPWWGSLLSTAILITAIGGASPVNTLVMAGQVFLLSWAFAWCRARRWDGKAFLTGLLIGLAAQTIALVATWGAVRPGGFSYSASQLGQTALLVWMLIPQRGPLAWAGLATAAITMSVSVARVPMAAAGLWTALRPSRRRWAMYGAIAVLYGLAVVQQGQVYRILPAGIIHSALARLELVLPTQTTPGGDVAANPAIESIGQALGVDPLWTYGVRDYVVEATESPPEYHAAMLTPLGYGLGGYVAATGLQRPHQVPVLLAFDMGLLAIVPFGIFAWAVWTRRVPWQVALTLLALWQFVEEPVSRVEGMWVTAAVLGSHARTAGAQLRTIRLPRTWPRPWRRTPAGSSARW